MSSALDKLRFKLPSSKAKPEVAAWSAAAAEPQAVIPVRDLERILALPKREPVDCETYNGIYTPATQALVEFETERLTLGPRKCDCKAKFGHACITTLNAMQAWVFYELRLVRGVVGRASVGSGKTVAGILAPLVVPGCREAVILIEPGQRQQYRLTYLRLREHFRVPSLRFHDENGDGYVVPGGAPTLRIVPYSRLSRGGATDLLGGKICPDFIISDEAHRLANRYSSQTSRLIRYMADHGDTTRFCAWSGTLVKKSIRDQYHLALYALGEGSPLPLDPDEVDAYANVFDPGARADASSPLAHRLYRTFGGCEPPSNALGFLISNYQQRLREGYQKRVSSTRGIVTTKGSSVGSSLYIRERKAPKIPQAVADALSKVKSEEKRPDGEVLVEPVERFRCLSEVACGFFYRWVYPHGEPTELIDRWFDARQAWNKELRDKLRMAEVHLDSPMLCANAAERAWRTAPYEGDLPLWKADTWPEWSAVKDLVYHESRAVWIDEFLAEDAAEWAVKNKGVVWYLSDALGKKIASIAGLPCHGGGPDSEKNLLSEKGDRSVICSIKAHGAGRDGLQRLFHHQLYAQTPSGGSVQEQLLGRLHRQGQEADEVFTDLYGHTEEFRKAFTNALSEAEFIQQTTGNQQKLMLADIDFDW